MSEVSGDTGVSTPSAKQLPPQPRRPSLGLVSIDSQNTNPQTVISGITQQTNAATQQVQQQVMQQPPTSLPAQTAGQHQQQNVLQHQGGNQHASQQDLQMSMQATSQQQLQQQQFSQTFSPQMSPHQNIPYNPNTTSQPPPVSQVPGQVLQQIPPQPLFQHQQQATNQQQQNVIISPQQQLDPQQNVIISPQQQQLGQQQVIMQPQILQPQQQQYQQQIQQPIAMLQTPMLYSANLSAQTSVINNTNNNLPAAQSTTTNSPSKSSIKKGRFRVVKGAATAASNNEAKGGAALLSDTVSVASSGGAASVADSSTVSTVKKGRFLVKKAAVPAAAATSASSANNDKKSSPESSDNVKVANNITNANASGGKASEPTVTAEVEAKGGDNQNKTTSTDATMTAPATAKPTDTISHVAAAGKAVEVTTKKKGRFLVKTGAASTPNLSALVSKSLPSAKSTTDVTGMGDQSAKDPEQRANAPKEAPITEQNNDNNTGTATGVDRPNAASTTKKKGRFVIKTGGGAVTSSPSAPALSTPALSTPALVIEGTQQQTGAGNIQFAQVPPAIPQIPNYIATNIPISIAGDPTYSLIDMNGQVVVVSNVALPMTQQVQHQHPIQPMPAAQPPIQPQFVSPPVQNTAVPNNVGQQLQHISSQPSNLNAPEPPPTHPSIPRPRILADERAESVSSVVKTIPNRTAGSSGSNWSMGRKAGKNGRMIGAGGVGKVLHYLDTLRSEVVEADRSMASLQSDNRILRDKNKELEAKIKDLERRLVEEKRLRKSTEMKYQSLCEEVLCPETNQAQLEHGANDSLDYSDRADAGHLPNNHSLKEVSYEQKIEYRGGANIEDLKTTTANTTSASQTKESEAKGNRARASTLDPSEAKDSDLKANHRLRASTGQDPLPPSSSRDNSFTDVCESDGSALSQSMTGLSSIAKQFDPLGVTTPASPSSLHQMNGIAVAQTMMAGNDNITIPMIVTTASSPPLAATYTPNMNNKKHFDPLGTPEHRQEMLMGTTLGYHIIPQIPSMTGGNVAALPVQMTSGNVATLPLIYNLTPQRHQQPQQQSQNQIEDPFEEILRLSASQSTL